jgi:hypothetical protein
MLTLAPLSLVPVLADSAGASAASSPPAQPPQVVTGAASAVSESSAVLAAAVNPEGQSTSYYVQYGPSTAYSAQTPRATLSASTTAHSLSIPLSALEAGTTFHYRIVATNATGSIDGKDATFKTAGVAPPSPAAVAPQVKTGPPVTADAHAVRVASALYSPQSAVSYYLEYGLTSAYGTATNVAVAPAAANVRPVTFTLNGLQAGAQYHYRVVAVGPAGPIYGTDEMVATRQATRVSPLGLTLSVSPVGATTIQVSGTLVLPAGVTRPQGCQGLVGIQIKRQGGATMSMRRTVVRSDCTYQEMISFSKAHLRHAHGLRVNAHFQGNTLLTNAASSPQFFTLP